MRVILPPRQHQPLGLGKVRKQVRKVRFMGCCSRSARPVGRGGCLACVPRCPWQQGARAHVLQRSGAWVAGHPPVGTPGDYHHEGNSAPAPAPAAGSGESERSSERQLVRTCAPSPGRGCAARNASRLWRNLQPFQKIEPLRVVGDFSAPDAEMSLAQQKTDKKRVNPLWIVDFVPGVPGG